MGWGHVAFATVRTGLGYFKYSERHNGGGVQNDDRPSQIDIATLKIPIPLSCIAPGHLRLGFCGPLSIAGKLPPADSLSSLIKSEQLQFSPDGTARMAMTRRPTTTTWAPQHL
jgi:hypothetical protein